MDTEKVKKNNKILYNFASSLISLLLVVLFFVFFSKKFNKLIYIFGCLIITKSLFNSFNVFINQETIDKNIKNIVNFSIFVELLISIIVIICTIFAIQNEKLKQIVLPITASILGGYLTLLGVGWTIKQSQKDKRDDYIKNNKPLLFIVNPTHYSDAQDIVLDKPNYDKKIFNGEKKYVLEDFLIENSDYSYSSLKGFMINSDFIELPIAQVFKKNYQYDILCNNIEFRYNKDIKHVYLVLLDMLDNKYICDLNYDIKDGKITINSIIETVMCK